MPFNQKRVTGGDWPPECDCCGRQLEPGEFYFELNRMGETILVCDICESEMESNPVFVEDVESMGPEFLEPDFHDEAFW